jgi:hypothetical protein
MEEQHKHDWQPSDLYLVRQVVNQPGDLDLEERVGSQRVEVCADCGMIRLAQQGQTGGQIP